MIARGNDYIRSTVKIEAGVCGAKLYLSPVMDPYNGEIMTFEMQDRPLYCPVGNMLAKAL